MTSFKKYLPHKLTYIRMKVPLVAIKNIQTSDDVR